MRRPADERDDVEIDLENDAREYLLRNALAYLAAGDGAKADARAIARSGEGRRIAGIIGEPAKVAATKHERIEVAIVDYRARLEAEERNSKTSVDATSTVNPK